MDIRILRYFLAVAREENITRAAEYLHIAQPSLSVQLIDLEKQLGKKLLIRGKRKITLTKEGVLLRKRAEEIISLLEKTEKELTAHNEIIGGDISIGSGESEAMNIAVEIATQLACEYPNIHYHLFSGDAEDITYRLDNGLLDFGILIEPVDITKYERVHLPVKDVWGILMKKDYALAEKEFISPDDIMNLPLIAPKRIGLQDELSSWLHKDFNSLNIVATYNLMHNASLLVNSGLGYALTLDKLVDTGPDSSLCFRPLKPKLEIQLSIAWKKYQVFSTAADKFMEKLLIQIKNT